MEQPIVIRFRWTADELLRASGYHFRHSCRPVFRFALHFIFALMLVAGAFGLRNGSAVSLPLSIGLLAGGIYWFALRPFERRWIGRRQFSKRPDRDMELEWQVAADKIRTQSGLGQSEFSWQIFAKMVRTPHGVLFYPTDQIFHWLPRSGFASDSDFERLVELARSKIHRNYEVA
jgi:YcxB-like protein